MSLRSQNKIKDLVIATHNKGKLREIAVLLSPYVENFYAASDLGLDEPEENGLSFSENALIKARFASRHSGKAALSDDSGLCVNALGGEPGIYSARWAGPNKDFSKAMERINQILADHKDRSAYFVCVLAIVWPDGREDVFEGRVDGHLTWPPRGDNGFGYDPFFIPQGHTQTFAEMEPEYKHSISHRAWAFEKLLHTVFS